MTHARQLPESLPALFARLASESAVASDPGLANYLLAKLSLWRSMDQAGQHVAWSHSALRPLLPTLLALSTTWLFVRI